MLNRLKRNESYSRSESDFEINWRLEEENASLNEQLVKMEDALTVARMDAGDAAEKIHNLEMKLNALEKDKIDEEGVFNAKLEEYISKMSSQQKHAEDALVQLKTKNESLSKRLRKRFDHFLSSVCSKKSDKIGTFRRNIWYEEFPSALEFVFHWYLLILPIYIGQTE